MSTEKTEIMQSIGMLNLRINDMMTQLNNTLKLVIEDNNALKTENDAFKVKPKLEKHIYTFKERENQRTDDINIYDIICEKMLVGWIHHAKNYTPHVRIMGPNHILDVNGMAQALKDAEIDRDGAFMILSEVQFIVKEQSPQTALVSVLSESTTDRAKASVCPDTKSTQVKGTRTCGQGDNSVLSDIVKEGSATQ